MLEAFAGFQREPLGNVEPARVPRPLDHGRQERQIRGDRDAASARGDALVDEVPQRYGVQRRKLYVA